MAKNGLFVGLVTIDLVYLTATAPQNNQKIVAFDCTTAAGGPATNAAVTFSHLGDRARLLGVVGSHPITQLIHADLESHGVAVSDLDPTRSEPPPMSSIIVTQAIGDRAVISINATKSQIACEQLFLDYLQNIDIVLIDGHQMEVGQIIAQEAHSRSIPIVIDGGSWKPGFEAILPLADWAICSANFYPPGCHQPEDVFAYLQAVGIPHIAITHGEKSIEYFTTGNRGELPVPFVKPVDTLGAGDIFHGAFCHYILQQNFTDALSSAAKIAAYSCQFFGTRQWLYPENKQ